MFRSKSGDDGTEDPDRVEVKELQDEYSQEAWLYIAWYGETYKDAWMNAPKSEVADLRDNI